MAKWKCKVCGFVYEGEQIPENYVRLRRYD